MSGLMLLRKAAAGAASASGVCRQPLAAPDAATTSLPCRPQPSTRRRACIMRSGDTGAAPISGGGEKALFGENFGARDPFPAELASNFGEKVLGNWDTNHIVKIPQKAKNVLGLTSRACSSEGASTAVTDDKELNLLKQQLPGWKVVKGKSGHQTLRFDWRLKDAAAAAQLQDKVTQLCQSEGHPVCEMSASGEMVFAELCTPSVSGLSANDFVLAAKINELDVKALLAPPRRAYNWA